MRISQIPEEMKRVNRKSIYCDGFENVENGSLVYTDELMSKVKKRFKVDLPKSVTIQNSETVAQLLVKGIIEPNCFAS